MFTDKQIEQLQANLDRSAVKSRSQAGFTLSYVEGWWCIEKANQIFGYGNWSRVTVALNEVCRFERKVGKANKNGWCVGYMATVKVSVFHDDGQWVDREGTGHGSGISTDLFDAIEGAAKEAETDAMKRALMTFGNQFGLALYDKDQKNVGVNQQDQKAKKESATEKAVAKAKEIKQLFDEATDKTQVLDDYFKEITWIKKHCPEAYKIIEDIA